jgi:3-oxoacyl-[acyl-carrier protein] reductase
VQGAAVVSGLAGRVALVTGGSRGLGRQMVLALAGAGARVVLTGTAATPELEATRAEAEALAGPGGARAVVADVRDPAACEAAVAVALDAFGRLDVLVNNAGRGMRVVSETFTTEPVRFWTVPVADWRTIVDTNFTGAFQMARAAMPAMLAQRRGRIVNISTSDITMVRTGYSPYGPTKAGLEAASRVWAQDAAGTGVTVNVLLPGGASDTDLLPGGPNRRGADGNLLDPAIMRAPIVWLAGAPDTVNGQRFVARLWNPALPPDEAAAAAR